ncbi:unnamed protein product [Blepharisma stoltei]|uniref:3-hydroxyisobutyryl-CoA hydrolase n=1 Tax=Blepharisma stoltei TaxID=1481888 RepID=A0AAU9JML9_9CILI|nr:unnamed protein product [Blepharisma stoltei]
MDSKSSNSDAAAIMIEQNNTFFLKFNRPNQMNACNLELSHAIQSTVLRALAEKKNIVFYGEGRAFCAGGDILGILQGEITPQEIFGAEVKTFYMLSTIQTHTVAMMDGITMGAGAGLAWACSIRVTTPKTTWAMPECSIGFCPDAGASYLLNRIRFPELGLYLQLTGERINGTDCYLFGFSHYYIEADMETVRKEIFEGGDIIAVLEKYHTQPNTNKSTILPVLRELRECFNTSYSLEFIMHKLREKGTAWSLRILEKLNSLCPLSLRVAHESFRRGRHISYAQSLIMEYNLAIQMLGYRPENFKVAVEHKMVNKGKGRANWVPSSLAEIGESTIIPYFANEEGRLEVPKL